MDISPLKFKTGHRLKKDYVHVVCTFVHFHAQTINGWWYTNTFHVTPGLALSLFMFLMIFHNQDNVNWKQNLAESDDHANQINYLDKRLLTFNCKSKWRGCLHLDGFTYKFKRLSLYLQAPCPDTYKGLHRKEPKLQDLGLAYANEVKHIIQRAHAGGRQVSGDIQLRFTKKFFISSMQIHFCFVF